MPGPQNQTSRQALCGMCSCGSSLQAGCGPPANQPIEPAVHLNGTAGQKCPEVRYLRTPCVTCAGVAHLTALQQLTQLSLAYTAVTDSGMCSLQRLTSLLDLNLDSCNITDR